VQEETKKSLSIPSSKPITWDIVDQRAKQLGFNTSSYTYHLYEKDINPNKKQRLKNNIILYLLLLLIMMEMIIILMVML